MKRALPPLALAATVAALAAAPAQAATAGSVYRKAAGNAGGAAYAPPSPSKPAPAPAPGATPGSMNLRNGRAIAPSGTPRRVRRVVTAANRLTRNRYRWGGGHAPFSKRLARGYDCSGAVSYALYGGRFLAFPLDSSGFKTWGRRGPGRWISVYANKGHAFVVVAGLRFDTSLHDIDAPRPRTGPRWSRALRPSKGFVVRHPAGY